MSNFNEDMKGILGDYLSRQYRIKVVRRLRKLKRDNALMRRWIKVFICREDEDAEWGDYLLIEIRAKMPGLFKGAK